MKSSIKTSEWIHHASGYLQALPILLLAIGSSGCAGKSASTIDNDGAVELEISVTGPSPVNANRKAARRIAGFAQASVLYTRSVYVDPINRPVSNFLSLSSFAVKSVGGLFRRVSIGTTQFPSLEAQAIPELSHAGNMDLVQWEKDLDKISGHKSEMGSIEFLVDGNEFFPRMLQTFESAEESIDIRTYIFDNDDYAVEVADYLKGRSNDVKVRVMVDGLGNLLASQAVAETAPKHHDAPLSIGTYLRKDSKVKFRARANPWLTGDHTKTTIVDSKVAFVGGMNIGREYRYDWHDLMMEVRGPIVDRLKFDSDKAWARAGILGDVGNFFRFLAGKKNRAEDGGYPVRALYTRNFDAQIYRAQIEAIRRSQNYILIENAYFSDDAILYELAKARRRGVDGRVILPTAGNHGALNASNQVTINKMLENGIRVYLFPGMSHVKAAIFDGWACVGSANFDKLSLEVNKELNLATSEPEVVNELLERVFYADMANSAEVSDMVAVTATHKFLETVVDEFL